MDGGPEMQKFMDNLMVLLLQMLLLFLSPLQEHIYIHFKSNGAPNNQIGCFLKFFGVPPPGWIKANIDGALLTSHKDGIGVTIRNDKGELVIVAGRQFCHWDSAQIEIDAILFIEQVLKSWMMEL